MSAWKEETFQGVIGRTVEESVPWWPKPDKPSEGRPNIVIILLDDLGFAHLAVTVPIFTRPIWMRWQRGGSATIIFIRRRFAHRRGHRF